MSGAPRSKYPRLAALGAELRFLMITSEAQVHELAMAVGAPHEAVPALEAEGGGVWIQVRVSAQPKCVRCWHHRPDVGESRQHPQLCGRCVGNLALPGETRRFS